MAPVDQTSYAHYLVARQAVQDSVANRLTPTEDQKITLIIIGVYTAAILILWNMPFVKIVLAPFKVPIIHTRSMSRGLNLLLTQKDLSY